jgi:hypothetical protein
MSNLQIIVTVGSEIDAAMAQTVLANWVQGNLLEPQYDRLFPKPIGPVVVGPTIESK